MASACAVILCCSIHWNLVDSPFRSVVSADAAISGLGLLLKVTSPVDKVTAGPGCCYEMRPTLATENKYNLRIYGEHVTCSGGWGPRVSQISAQS